MLAVPLQADFSCRACHAAFVNEHALDQSGLCAVCAEALVNFDSAYSYGAYDSVLRQLIHLYKYAKVETLSEPLSRLLIRAIPLNEDFDAVLAMPMHWRKQWQRGFNQAELIAEPVARRFGLKLSHNLGRKRYTKAQAGLDKQERSSNLKDSFSLRRPEQIRGKRFLLVDDVFTTGATLRTTAGVLKAAGAVRVTALTLARVDHRVPQSRESDATEHHRSFDQSSFLSPTNGIKSQTAGTGVK